MTGTGPAAAVAALSAALGVDPGRGDLWAELAAALVAAGRPEDAWDAAVRAVELAPQSAASHRAIGTVAAALGDPAQAESAYRHALLLDPTDHTTRTALARLPTSAPPPADGARRPAPSDSGPTTGRRRAPDPADLLDGSGSTGGSRHAAEDGVGGRAPAPTARSGRRRAAEPGDGDDDRPGAPSWSAADPARSWPEALSWSAADPARSWPGAPSWSAAGAVPAASSPGAGTVPGPAEGGSRHAAAEPLSHGRHGVPDQPHGAVADSQPPAWPGTASTPWGGPARRTPAVGLPAWLGPSSAPGRDAPVGATRVADPAAWRRGLIAVVRLEWVVGVVCFVGLAYARTAPYTAGLLAGALVVAGAYVRLRWQGAAARRPPEPDRVPTYAAVTALATAVVIIPAAMAGALTLARLAAAAAVTCATVASVLLARTVGT